MYKLLITMALVFFVSPSFGATQFFRANVVKIMTDSTNFGGCMALLSTSPQSVLPNCKTGWVTFSCTGEHQTKDLANRLYSAAQLALVTAKPVDIRVNDLKMHNGYCLADRIDNT